MKTKAVNKDLQKNPKHFKKNNYYSNNKNQQYQQYNYWQGNNNNYYYNTQYGKSANEYSHYKNKYGCYTQSQRIIDDEDIFRNLNINGTQIHKKKEREEVLRVNIALMNVTKEIIIYEGDDVSIAAASFCNDNKLPSHLIRPLSDKLKVSLDSINAVVNNNLGDNDVHILETIWKLYNDGFNNDNKKSNTNTIG